MDRSHVQPLVGLYEGIAGVRPLLRRGVGETHRSPYHHSARIGEEVTLKRYERTGAHTAEFQPESTNPEHKPIRVDARTDDVAIVGIVVGTIIGTRRRDRSEEVGNIPERGRSSPKSKSREGEWQDSAIRRAKQEVQLEWQVPSRSD